MAILSKSNRKRHTKPCLYFQTNNCPLSANECDFAHVIATPEQYETLKNPQATLRTKPCRFYLAGQCRDGYWCRFKHPANMFAASRESDASLLDDVPELDSDKGTDDDVDVRDMDGAWRARPEEHPKYRTRPCRNFILGKCIYGDRCSYLHVVPPPRTQMNGISPASLATACPSPTSYFPATPPSHCVPPSTPVNARLSDSDVDVFDRDPSTFKTPVRSRFNHETTPSTSSCFSEEPATPATPATPGPNDYVPFARSSIPSLPISPLSPLSYATQDYLAKTRSPLDCMPLSPPPPLSLYSPTSPVPLRIVHVPFAVPMYQEMSPSPSPRRITVSMRKSQPLRQRVSSQSNAEVSVNSQECLPHHTKPRKFFSESGSCQKGMRCDFSHTPASPSPLGKRTPVTHKEPASSKLEKEQKAPLQRSESRESSSESKENKPNNFYKITWRVVGGGVKMGSNNAENRRHSEGTAVLSQRRPSFRNPFDSMGLPSTTSTLSRAILKDRAHSITAPTNSQSSTLPSTKKGPDKTLALTLQAYSLSKASAASNCPAAAGTCPIVLVQGDADENTHRGETGSERLIGVSRQDVARAKSSPSSPVAMHHDLPSMIFSAESP